MVILKQDEAMENNASPKTKISLSPDPLPKPHANIVTDTDTEMKDNKDIDKDKHKDTGKPSPTSSATKTLEVEDMHQEIIKLNNELTPNGHLFVRNTFAVAPIDNYGEHIVIPITSKRRKYKSKTDRWSLNEQMASYEWLLFLSLHINTTSSCSSSSSISIPIFI